MGFKSSENNILQLHLMFSCKNFYQIAEQKNDLDKNPASGK